MDEIRKWFRDPNDDFMCPYMIRLDDNLDQGRIISVGLKPNDNASNSTSSLTVRTRATEFHIMAKGILKSAREEAGGVVLLPLYQGGHGGLEVQGKRTGNYSNQPVTPFHVPVYENTREVRRVLQILMQNNLRALRTGFANRADAMPIPKRFQHSIALRTVEIPSALDYTISGHAESRACQPP